MFGFPTRPRQTSRSAPTVSRFDPSGDVRCTGWWRADRNLTVTSQGAVTSWANIITPYQAFTTGGSVPGLLIPRFTNRFPAVVLGSGTAPYVANQLAHDGDRQCTLTCVCRVPYGGNNTGSMTLTGQDIGVSFGDNSMKFITTLTYQQGWINSFAARGLTVVAVVTARVRETAVDNTVQQVYVTFNAQQLGPFSSTVSRTSSPTSELRLSPSGDVSTFWHEVIHFRSFLSDGEVATMHTALQNQYRGT